MYVHELLDALFIVRLFSENRKTLYALKDWSAFNEKHDIDVLKTENDFFLFDKMYVKTWETQLCLATIVFLLYGNTKELTVEGYMHSAHDKYI